METTRLECGGCGTHTVSALASVTDSVLPGLPAEGPSMENTAHILSRVFSQSLMEGPGEDFGSNSSSMEVESRGYGVRSHPKLPREFEAASATLDSGPGHLGSVGFICFSIHSWRLRPNLPTPSLSMCVCVCAHARVYGGKGCWRQKWEARDRTQGLA